MLWLLWLLLALALASFLVYAFALEPYRLRLTHKVLIYPDLPPGVDGFTILHLSDLHFRRRNSHHQAQFLASLGDLDCDLVAITGDILDTSSGRSKALEVLAGLRGRLGVYAVLGNHDYADFSLKDILLFRDIGSRRHQVDDLVKGLEERKIRVLDNENVSLSQGTTTLCLIGVGDTFTGHGDLAKALRGVPRDGFKLLLSHNPDLVKEVEGKVDLVLAGHTHGGQVRFPLLGAPHRHSRLLGRHRPWGTRKLGRTYLHTSPGLGTTVLPARFRAPPEATILELRTKSHEGPGPG